MNNQNQDYTLTLFEACEYLNKSSRTISRYIRRGILHPLAQKSRQGTLEYRFSKSELEAVKKYNDQTRLLDYGSDSLTYQQPTIPQVNQFSPIPPVLPVSNSTPVQMETTAISGAKTDSNEVKRQDENNQPDDKTDEDIITLLKETTEMLRGQLKVKDDQIKDLGTKIDQLIERGRETNILLKGMQDKMLRLEQPVIVDNKIVDKSEDIKINEINARNTGQNNTAAPDEVLLANQIKKSNKNKKKNTKNNKQEGNEKISENENKKQDQKKGFFNRLFG